MNLETDNPDKGELLQRSAHHRELLEDEVKQITERSEKIITNALIIGGALALTYFMLSSVAGGAKKSKRKPRKIRLVENEKGEVVPEADDTPEEAGIVSQIGTVLVAQATGFLLNIAREKLVEFLHSQAVKKEQTHESSE